MIAFLNGEFLDERDAQLPLADRGFLYGDGVFETMRAVDQRIFQWPRHWQRLRKGAAFLKLPLPWSGKRFAQSAAELLRKNHSASGVVRLTVSRGAGPRGYSAQGAAAPIVAMTFHPAPAQTTEGSAPPIKVVFSSFKLWSRDPLAPHKTCNKLRQILARAEADGRGADEAILLNEIGRVAEGTASNIFWIERGVICTPPLETGIMPGTTRALVFDLCRENRWRLRETVAGPQTLLGAEGIFMTQSSRGITAVSRIEKAPAPLHPLIRELQASYGARLAG